MIYAYFLFPLLSLFNGANRAWLLTKKICHLPPMNKYVISMTARNNFIMYRTTLAFKEKFISKS